MNLKFEYDLEPNIQIFINTWPDFHKSCTPHPTSPHLQKKTNFFITRVFPLTSLWVLIQIFKTPFIFYCLHPHSSKHSKQHSSSLTEWLFCKNSFVTLKTGQLWFCTFFFIKFLNLSPCHKFWKQVHQNFLSEKFKLN